jgi:hypothetical protein
VKALDDHEYCINVYLKFRTRVGMCRSKTRSKWGTAAGTIKERMPSPASTTRWIAILIKKKEAVRFRSNMGSRSDQIPEMASVFDRPRGPVNGLESCCSVVYLLCRVAQFLLLLLLLSVKKPLTSRMRKKSLSLTFRNRAWTCFPPPVSLP